MLYGFEALSRRVRNWFILRSHEIQPVSQTFSIVCTNYNYERCLPLLQEIIGMDQCMLKLICLLPTPQTLSFPLNLITRHLFIPPSQLLIMKLTKVVLSIHEFFIYMSTLLNFFQFHTCQLTLITSTFSNSSVIIRF